MTSVMYDEDGEEKMGSLTDRAQEQLGLNQKDIDEILGDMPMEI